MIQVDRKKLFDKLSPICNQTLELACAFMYDTHQLHRRDRTLAAQATGTLRVGLSAHLLIIEAFQLDIALSCKRI